MFQFYPGQPDFLARVAITPAVAPGFDLGRLITAETGAGKTPMAILLARLKLEADRGAVDSGLIEDAEDAALPSTIHSQPSTFSGRALFLVPGATARGRDAQWFQELAKFAPGVPVFRLFTWNDYLRAVDRGRVDCGLTGAADAPPSTIHSPSIHSPLPPGIYVTYPEAFFRNGTRGGRPSLADRIQPSTIHHSPSTSPWDFIAVDEAHTFAKLDTVVTEGLLKLQARWRYAFTATPTPDRLPDLFPAAGLALRAAVGPRRREERPLALVPRTARRVPEKTSGEGGDESKVQSPRSKVRGSQLPSIHYQPSPIHFPIGQADLPEPRARTDPPAPRRDGHLDQGRVQPRLAAGGTAHRARALGLGTGPGVLRHQPARRCVDAPQRPARPLHRSARSELAAGRPGRHDQLESQDRPDHGTHPRLPPANYE
jgi:hypothetical protein